MPFIGALVVGALAGIVAKLLTPGHLPGGFLVSIVLGIAGAELATWIADSAGWAGMDSSAALVGAAGGAVVVLLPVRLLPFRRRL